MLSKRKKYLATQITLGLMFSLSAGLFSNTGFAAEDSYKNENIKYYNGGALGITELVGVDVNRTIGGSAFQNVTIEANNPAGKNATATGIYLNPGADVSVLGEQISITAINEYEDARSRTIEFGVAKGYNQSKLVLGDANTKTIDIVSHSKGEAIGVFVSGGADVSRNAHAQINGGLLNVDVRGDSNGKLVSGIHVANNTANETMPDNGAYLEINADKTIIKSNGIGVSSYSNGTLKVKGDLTVEAETAVSARGYSKIEINNDKQNTVQLKGDVEFNYDQASSGTPIEADVTINLSDADSYLHGNIIKSGDFASTMTVNDKQKVTGMTLDLSNNAQWTTDADSFVNKLVLDNGIVNINGGENQTVSVGRIDGSGTVNLATSKTDAGFVSGKLAIGTTDLADDDKQDATANLDVNYTGITADDLQNNVDDMVQLASNISVKDETNTGLTAKANVAEGLLKGAVSADLDTTASGSSIVTNSVKQSQESSTMTSMRNVASVAIVSWRQEDSTLGQRLGELRSSAGDQGIWARMNRGEFEYSGAYKNQYNFFQLGYDKVFGSWHYGAAVSHNDGKTTYDNGKGENKSTSLSLYGTWLGDKGHYADIVLKQGRLSNEYDNYAAAGHTHGDYNAWGTSLSGEYGMKVGLDNGWYVTPQAQLTLMRIGGEDYTTNNGIHVSQDTLKSCVGRIGFEAGKAVGSKGSIYAKASLLHEFAGNADTYLSLNGISNSYSQDIGGTWYEVGLGFNFKTTANSYVYADVVKTFGDDIKTPWQWNVGARWTF